MDKVNHTATGYNPPSIWQNLLSLLKIWFAKPTSSVDLKTASQTPYPASVKTDISMMPFFFQSTIPDCVENSVTYAKMYYDYKKTGKVPNLSRRWLFLNSIPSQNGTNVRTALNQAMNGGIAEAIYCPDDHEVSYEQFTAYTPTPEATANAQTHKITGYAFLNEGLDHISLKSLISQFGLVIIGLDINQKWWKPSWNYPGMFPLTLVDAKDPTLSYHCVVLYGYDENYYYFCNWWSADWGNQGTGYFSAQDLPDVYEYAIISD